jgi:hypothetical protein
MSSLNSKMDKTQSELHAEIAQVTTDTRKYVDQQIAGLGGKGDVVNTTSPDTSSPNTGNNGMNDMTNTTTTSDPLVAHWARLAQLDPTFRTKDYVAWLQAAGVTFDQIVRDARQPEEETSPTGKILVSGRQVVVTNAHVMWPNIITTDHPSYIMSKDSNEFQLQPDPSNGSILYTNVTVSGPVTIWVSGYSWGQFASHFGNGNVVDNTSSVISPDTNNATNSSNEASNSTIAPGCPATIADLKKFGTGKYNWQDSNGSAVNENSGNVAGVQMSITSDNRATLTACGWTIQDPNNDPVATAWSPDNIRPLK